ncbi:MAG: FtsQ-type POTRA domain-containing protein [Halanaerobium sp.]|nr:FtsQ-type POTRA domain-containing protein [Halanaerobium sp.]
MKITKRSLAVIFLLLATLFILINSSLFTVKEIEVRGNYSLSAEEVIDRLGLEKGISIWDINVQKLRLRLQPDLLVESASVRRQLPDKLVVEIIERQGVGWIVASKFSYLVDKEGHILQKQEIEKEAGLELPLLMGFRSLTIEEDRILINQEVEAVLAYLSRFSRDRLAQISEVIIDGDIILIHLLNKTEIRTSTERPVLEMTGIIFSLWDTLQEGNVEYLDLRFKGAPVIKYKNR